MSATTGPVLALGASTGLVCAITIRKPKTDDDPGPFWSNLRMPAVALWGTVVGVFVAELIWATLGAVIDLGATEHASQIGTAVALVGMIVGALTRLVAWGEHLEAASDGHHVSAHRLP